jgi:hypothetical protein
MGEPIDGPLGVDSTEPTGMSRRQVLRAGAAVGAGLLWVAPVVSGLGLTAAHADSTSGGNSPPPPPNSPPPPPNSPPPPPPPPNSPPNSPPPPPTSPPIGTAGQPVGLTVSPPEAVLGEQFTKPQASAVVPAAVLPFTGAAMPIKTATLIGAGLIATGAAAVTASRLREQPVQPGQPVQAVAAPADHDDPPMTGPKHAAH